MDCSPINNSLATVGYLQKVFIRLWIFFFGLYFHFCLKLALETLYRHILCGFMTLATPTYSLNRTIQESGVCVWEGTVKTIDSAVADTSDDLLTCMSVGLKVTGIDVGMCRDGNLGSEHSIVNAPPDQKLPKMPEIESLKGKRSVFYTRLCKKADKQPFLQPAATATMHCHPEGCTHPPLSIPPFLLVQNLSSKLIALTDNMQPKVRQHQEASSVVKGLNGIWFNRNLEDTCASLG